MKEFIFEAEQFVPHPLEKTFDFFSDAKNLERITPPILNFKILTPLPINIKVGTIIDYKLKIHGVPWRWKTLIEKWNPPYEFVDTQLKGPYKLWHHTHSFKEVPGGTLMKDVVRYKLPFGPLGLLVQPILVKPDIQKIFSYRKQIIGDLLNK